MLKQTNHERVTTVCPSRTVPLYPAASAPGPPRSAPGSPPPVPPPRRCRRTAAAAAAAADAMSSRSAATQGHVTTLATSQDDIQRNGGLISYSWWMSFAPPCIVLTFDSQLRSARNSLSSASTRRACTNNSVLWCSVMATQVIGAGSGRRHIPERYILIDLKEN